MREALNKKVIRSIYERAAKSYDRQHCFFTGGSDGRGRRILVQQTVKSGDKVLDAGAGTGSTALLAAHRVGPTGKIVLFDLCEGMLAVARQKIEQQGYRDRVTFRTGDILDLPFADGAFDVVLSTYSLCPVYSPEVGARELYRVVHKGGLLGIAHSAEPGNRVLRWLSDGLETIVWKLPWLSLGCRAISVLPYLREQGAVVLYDKRIGFPLWPFRVFVVRKPK